MIGFRALHTLEGALRSQSRREGRFLAAHVPFYGKSASQSYQINCILNSTCCSFFLRFEALGPTASGESSWRCVEIRSRHSCISAASSPTEKLKWRLDFWVSYTSALPRDAR